MFRREITPYVNACSLILSVVKATTKIMKLYDDDFYVLIDIHPWISGRANFAVRLFARNESNR